MTSRYDPEDVQQLVRLLARGDVAGLAREAGIDPSSVYRYLAGTATPRPATLRRLVAGSGLSTRFVETLLLPAVRAARIARAPLSESFLDDFEAASKELAAELDAAALIQLTLFLSQLEDPQEWWERADLSPEEERRHAGEIRSRLEACSAEDRQFLLENGPDLQRSLAEPLSRFDL